MLWLIILIATTLAFRGVLPSLPRSSCAVFLWTTSKTFLRRVLDFFRSPPPTKQAECPEPPRPSPPNVTIAMNGPNVVITFGKEGTPFDDYAMNEFTRFLGRRPLDYSKQRVPFNLTIQLLEGDWDMHEGHVQIGRLFHYWIGNFISRISALEMIVPGTFSIDPTRPVDEELLFSYRSPATRLEHFKWVGRVDTLPYPWRWLSHVPFRQLITLDLTCSMSMDDCILILGDCARLRSFSLRSLHNIPSVMENDLGPNAPSSPVQGYLKCITLSSSVSLRPLFARFKLPEVQCITLYLSNEATRMTRPHELPIPWKQLKIFRLKGEVTDQIRQTIKGSCSDSAKVEFDCGP